MKEVIKIGVNNIFKKRPHVFCINNVSKYEPIIVQFFNTYYPNKSPYEN